MKTSRLSTIMDDGALDTPDGNVMVFRPTMETDLSGFDASRVIFDQGFYPFHQALLSKGFTPFKSSQTVELAVVCPTKSKVESRGLIAQACAVAKNGVVVVDGQKTDGIESLYKDVRKRVELSGMLAKAHGRIFWFNASDAFDEWALDAPQKSDHGFFTTPGIFSPDAVDKGSAVLVDILPKLKGHVVDLGAGWGFLAAHILKQNSVQHLDVVEAEAKALRCAKLNVSDDRAHFHWADATDFAPKSAANFVVSNPPFHTGRSAEPDLGRRFIQSAARMLAPSGSFIMVANRHLPYEATVEKYFRQFDEIGGNAGFKVILASRPTRHKA